REKYGPIVREADHRVHEGFFGDWSEDRAKHQRGDRKLQPLEAVAEDAEADDQPQIGDVVADRQGTDEAEDKHIGGYATLRKIQNLHHPPNSQTAHPATLPHT